MKRIKSFLTMSGIAGVALLCASCGVYQTNLVDVPLISKKNDIRIDGGVSFVAPSIHGTISYGLTEKIAIQAYASTNTGHYLQGSVGYYKNFKNSTVMEIYGGAASGYGSAYKDANPGHLRGNYQLYFTQVNFGKINGNFAHMEFGLSVKAGYLHSDLTDMNYYTRQNPPVDPYVTYHDNSMLIEPVGFVRMGGEKLKFNLKLGATHIIKYTNAGYSLPYSPVSFGVSVNYLFSVAKKHD